jgi:TonB-linked SusC/RagA family outer membrane protein
MELGSYPYLNRGNKNFLSSTGNASENAYRSYFGRVTYDILGRYLFQFNARYDMSSRFNSAYRGGFFPSASFGWVVTEEPWIKAMDLKTLNFLKFRASYGTLGNEKIGNYPYQSIMDLGSVPMYTATEIISMMTAAQTAYAIPDITWETTKTWNVGVDLAMFRNRLTLTADVFQKNTYNMLLSRKIPDVLGYSDPQDNIGDMHTKGWELQVGWSDRVGDFSYAASFNVSDYTSIMGNLGGYQSLGSNIIKEGVEYNAWYGYKSPGLFLSQEEIDNAALLYTNVRPGDVRYSDLSGPDGEPDGIINADYDRTVLGSSTPHYQYGGTLNFGWKNWDLAMAFQGVGYVLTKLDQAMVYRDGDAYTFPVEYDKWYYSELKTPEQNAKAKYPRATLTNSAKNNYEQMTDFWLFNGAYFRMKNITLSYTIPSRLTKRFNVQRLRLYTSATDPFSISNFPQGWDPESYANLSAYMVKTFTVGAQITF